MNRRGKMLALANFCSNMMKSRFIAAVCFGAAVAVLAVSCRKEEMPVSVSMPDEPIAATASETSLSLSWEAVEGVSAYKLEAKDDSDYEYETEVSGTSFELTGLQYDTEYSVRLGALASDGTVSAWSGWQVFRTLDVLVADSFAGGTGTESDPYLISKASQLAFLAKCVNGETEGYFEPGVYYKLTADIDLGRYENWTPIGTGPEDGLYPYENPVKAFQGVFDGDGHSITSLSVNLTGTTAFTSAGLFGVNDGTIRNVNVAGEVHAVSGIEDKGYVVAGGIAGFNIIAYADAMNTRPGSGAIEHCSFSGSVSASCGEDLFGTADAGGICGMAESGNIDYCSVSLGDSDSIVSTGGETSMSGGIAGAMNGGRLSENSLSGSGSIEAAFNSVPDGYYVYAQTGGIAGSVNEVDLYSCTVDFSGSLSVPEGGEAVVNMGIICGNSSSSISSCTASFSGKASAKSGGAISFGGIAGQFSGTSSSVALSSAELGGSLEIEQTDEYSDVNVGGIFGTAPAGTASVCSAVLSGSMDISSAVVDMTTNVNVGGIAGVSGKMTAGCSAEWTDASSVKIVSDRSNFGGLVGLAESSSDMITMVASYALCDADVTLDPNTGTDFCANAGGIAGTYSGAYIFWYYMTIPAYMYGCYSIVDGSFSIDGANGGKAVAGVSEYAELDGVFWGSRTSSVSEDLEGSQEFSSLDEEGFASAIAAMNAAVAEQGIVASYVYDPVKGVPVLAAE